MNMEEQLHKHCLEIFKKYGISFVHNQIFIQYIEVVPGSFLFQRTQNITKKKDDSTEISGNERDYHVYDYGDSLYFPFFFPFSLSFYFCLCLSLI